MSSSKSPSQRKAAPRQTAEQNAPTSGKSGQSGKQGGKSTQVAHHKKRGFMLTVALALILADAILTAVLMIVYRKDNIDESQVPLFLGLAVLAALAAVAGAVGMWFWKRWAVYLYLVAVAGSVVVGVVAYASVFAAFHAVIPLLLLGAGLSTQNSIRDFS